MTQSSEDVRPAPQVPATTPIVFEAIVKRQAISATYNKGAVTLAPHVLYTKHDELYVDAVTIERDGQPPREEKLGAFKVSGLGALRITPRRFARSMLFSATDPKYAGTTLMAVEG